LFAALTTWAATPTSRSSRDGVDGLGVGGFAAAAVGELVATARADGAQADAAQAALALLLRIVDGECA
jgi:hypothetical protein